MIGSDEGTTRAGLTWSGLHVVVMGWIINGVGCHAMIKGAELSCELDYTISFWSWILSWKNPYFMEIPTFRGYYPHFVYISTFRGYYPHFVYISVFPGNIHVLWILSAFGGNIHVPWILSAFCACIRISWRLSAFCGNIHVPWISSAFNPFYLSNFTHLVKVTGALHKDKKKDRKATYVRAVCDIRTQKT